MLPFVRMLEYGNIKENIQVKQMYASATSMLVLMSNGNVYGRGYNQQGSLGQSDPSSTLYNNRWVLVDTDVNIIACSKTNSIMIKNDGRVIGRGINFTTSSGAVYPYTGTDITASFNGIDMRNVKKIYPNGVSCLFLLNDGRLYGIGGNVGYMYGNQSLTFQTSPYLIDSNVSNVFRTIEWQTTCHYIKNSKLYCTGSNGYNFYSTGLNQTTVQTTYIEVPLPAGYEPLDIISSGIRSSIIARETSTGNYVMMYCGSNGRSANSPLYDRGVPSEDVFRTFQRSLITYMDNKLDTPSFKCGGYNLGRSNFVYGSNKIYSCGFSGGIGRPIVGSVTSIWTFAEANIEDTPSDDIIGYITINDSYFTILCTKNKMYYSGTPNYEYSWFKELGTATMDDKFYEIPLPI